MKKRNKKGFTLAELLIVVAIIAVLVAISIPIFTGQLERARRAVDMHTARSIESVLVSAVNDGTVQIQNAKSDKEIGVWVMICRDENSWPEAYTSGSKKYKTAFCGSEGNILINGVVNTGAWNSYNESVEKILNDANMSVSGLEVKSKGTSGGWDWIIIEAGYMNNQVFSRIYSGFKGQPSSVSKFEKGTTNIEKMMG